MRWPWQPKDPNPTERPTATPPDAAPVAAAPGVLSTWDPVPDPPALPVDPGPLHEPGAPWVPRRMRANRLTVWTRPMEPDQSWDEVEAEAHAYGCHPVLVEQAFWAAFEDPATDGHHPPARFTSAIDPDDPDGAAWLRRRRDARSGDAIPVVAGDVELMARVEPTAQSATGRPCGHLSIDAEDTVMLVPVSSAWEIPEALSWDGATNDGIDGRDHTAILRRWAGLYGARPVALGHFLTLLVDRPPTADTLSLACEWLVYCENTVLAAGNAVSVVDPDVRQPLWHLSWD